MKTAASYAEVAARRGWVNLADMDMSDYLVAERLWVQLYKTHDMLRHFLAATRSERPNKVSIHRMNTFTDAYNLARLRGEL